VLGLGIAIICTREERHKAAVPFIAFHYTDAYGQIYLRPPGEVSSSRPYKAQGVPQHSWESRQISL
jgi:hypothetical protein